MKLEGSLDAFSLPDIFQLLSFTKKTGGLHLASAGSDGVVFFGGGSITGASADSSRQPLARRLVCVGAVPEEALSAAVTTAISAHNLGVVGALRSAGAVEAELLRTTAEDQTIDAVLGLMRWQSGDFAFVVDEANPDDVGMTITVSALLEAVAERQGTWDQVAQVIPSPKTVLAMASSPAGDDVQMSREEWALLSLLDGRRTVSDVVDLSGAGQFSVVSRLAALVQRGLLTVSEPDMDHATIVLRRLAMLEPLEHFVPAPAEPAEEAVPAASAAAVPSAPGLPTQRADSAPDESGDAPAPVDEVESVQQAEVAEAETAVVESAEETVQREMALLGGAHVPGDVVPPRPEPFLPRRAADFDDHAELAAVRAMPSLVSVGASDAGEQGAAEGVATSAIERDASINRSLMLRLIAGVRGL